MAALTLEQAYAAARAAGFTPAQAVIAAAIAKAESGLNPTVLGDTTITTSTWGPSVGLWQVRSLKGQALAAASGADRHRDAARLTDPARNAAAAYAISRRGTDWRPWSVYTSGAYRRHLGAAGKAGARVEATTGAAAAKPAAKPTFAPWEPASRCVGGAQPGAQALMNWALATQPGARDSGIYSCRNVKGGGGLSAHAEGRALDIAFPGTANPGGTALVERLRTNAERLGIGTIIWNRRIYSERAPAGTPYTGADPHTGHVHVELTRAAAAGGAAATTSPIGLDWVPGSGVDLLNRLPWVGEAVPDSPGEAAADVAGTAAEGLVKAVTAAAETIAEGVNDTIIKPGWKAFGDLVVKGGFMTFGLLLVAVGAYRLSQSSASVAAAGRVTAKAGRAAAAPVRKARQVVVQGAAAAATKGAGGAGAGKAAAPTPAPTPTPRPAPVPRAQETPPF